MYHTLDTQKGGGGRVSVFLSNVFTGNFSKGRLWHARVGHKGKDTTTLKLLREAFGSDVNFDFMCSDCIQSKAKRVTTKFPPSLRKATRPGYRLHTDLIVLSNFEGLGGYKYVMVILDEYTNYVWALPLHKKSEFADKLLSFLKYVGNHLNAKVGWVTTSDFGPTPGVAQLRSDNAMEQVSKEVASICQNAGIRHETIVPYSSHQNGRVERIIATLWEGSESIRRSGGFPSHYWPFCLQAYAYVRNRLPASSDALHTFRTPWEAWEGVEVPFKNLVAHFRTIGSLVYVYVPKPLRRKFDPKALKAVFLGYSNAKKGYIAQLLESGKIVHFEHGYWDETQFPFVSGIRSQWFKDQLNFNEHVSAGENDLNLSLSDDLISWDDQPSTGLPTQKLSEETAEKMAVPSAPNSPEDGKMSESEFSFFNHGTLPPLEPCDASEAIRTILGHDNPSRDITQPNNPTTGGNPENTPVRANEDSKEPEISLLTMPTRPADQFWADKVLGHRTITKGAHAGEQELIIRWCDDQGDTLEATWEPSKNFYTDGVPGPILKDYIDAGKMNDANYVFKRSTDLQKLLASHPPDTDAHSDSKNDHESHDGSNHAETPDAGGDSTATTSTISANFSKAKIQNVRKSFRPIKPARADILKALKARIDILTLAAQYKPCDPSTRKQALSSPDREKWILGEREELAALQEKDVMKLTNLKPDRHGRVNGHKVIGTRWVYKLKTNPERFKARLVAQDYLGVDQAMFSPTPRIKSFKTLLAILANQPHGGPWRAEQCDISTAYLYASVHDIIYVKQPPGYEAEGHEGCVMQLNKSLYGLGGSSSRWYEEIKSTLLEMGFKQTKADDCLFILSKGVMKVYLVLYVDDMVFVHNNGKLMNYVYDQLTEKYNFSSRGPLEHYLGLSVHHEKDGSITLSQTDYIDRVLERFGLENVSCSNIHTPMITGPAGRLSQRDCPKTHSELQRSKARPYAEAVGALQWMVGTTRPDIAYAVSAVSRYMANHGDKHWAAVLRILKYIKNTRTQVLRFPHNPTGTGQLVLASYCDADWASEEDGRRSQGGYICTINGAAVACRSMRQRIVTLSSMESEYVSAGEAAKEVIWLRLLLKEMGYPQPGPTIIWEDNRAAICLSENPTNHNRTKHIDVRHHWLRQLVHDKIVKLQAIKTTDQLADILTKNTERSLFIKLRNRVINT
jgi:hypothetical protein